MTTAKTQTETKPSISLAQGQERGKKPKKPTMASSLIAVNRATSSSSATNQTLTLFRFSFTNFLKHFSTSPSSTSQNPKTDTSNSKKPKRRKKKNLFEVAQFLPKWGIGYHMAKSHWTNVSYEITKINLYKDGKHGKAWGIAHKDGLPIADAPKKISGVHKRCWKYIPSLAKSIESKSNPPKSTETTEKSEVQAA